MKLRITEAVLAEAYRAKVCRERMEELAESIRKSVKERHSLPKMRIRLAEYGNDTELMLAAVSALRKDKEAPSARDRDFRAWMLMLCRSREYEVICYMCNELTDAWERKYRTREMLVLCDVLHTLKGHARTNEMTNRVCDYFFRERRNKLYGKTFRIEEKDMVYAESRLPELDKAVFRMTVNHYSHRTFVAEELAGLCGMHHQSEHGSGVTQSPFLCLCNSRNMVVNLLMMMFLRINSLLRKNLSVELKKLDFYFNICH